MTRAWRKTLIVALFLAASAFPARAEDRPPPPALNDAVVDFLSALETRYEAYILDQLGGDPWYGDGGRLNAYARDILFSDAPPRPTFPEGRSPAQIIALGDTRTLIDWHGDDAVAFFYPASLTEASRNPAFWLTRWGKDFFACEFRREAGTWRLAHGLCFDETCGPFPWPY
jgi:hypothetical protein